MNGDQFDADYFENGVRTGRSCYENYRWLPDLTFPMVEEIIEYMNLQSRDRVLDFGCAKGYVVKALRQLGFPAVGVDISAYAIENADPAVKDHVALADKDGLVPALGSGVMDAVIAKDVLEHIPEGDIGSTLKAFHDVMGDGAALLVVVPLGAAGTYVIPEMEADDTHIIRKPLGWWRSQIAEWFEVMDARYSIGPVTKARWSRAWPTGHGFVLAMKDGGGA